MDGKKALIGMSGGVDSSVAALLMLRAGYECIGATMRLYDNDMIGLEKGHTCCSLDDVEDARSVARRLGISSGRSSGNLSAATNAAALPTPASTATGI